MTFHVSLLRKYIPDPTHILEAQPIQLKENLSYEEEPVQILCRKEQVLRNKTIYHWLKSYRGIMQWKKRPRKVNSKYKHILFFFFFFFSCFFCYLFRIGVIDF